MSLQNKAELLDFWVYQRKIRINMPNNPYFSNVVKPNSGGGRSGGGFVGKIIGGLAQEHRAKMQHEYAADLIKQRAVGEIVSKMATSSIASESEKTDMENRREHYKTLTDDIHSHLTPEERKAAGIGNIDAFLVGGKDFQQLGQSRVGRIKPGENPAGGGKGNANPNDAMDTSRSNDDSSYTDTYDDENTPPKPQPSPTPDTFTDQTPPQAAAAKKTPRKRSAAKPKADTSTSKALSSKSVTQNIADSNKEDN